jgi:thioesterase domain-containing protein/acyl carrier protein
MKELTTVNRAPRDEIERALVRIWSDVLEAEVDDRFADFFQLGGHSLAALRVIGRVQDAFGIAITSAEMLAGPTLIEMAALIRERQKRTNASGSGVFVELRPGGDAAPFVVVPPWTAPLITQAQFLNAVPAGRPLYGLQPPGLDSRMQPLASIDDEAALYFDELVARPKLRGFCLLAICGGTYPVLELARRLQAAGHEPRLVVLLDPVELVARTTPRHRQGPIDHLRDFVTLVRQRRLSLVRNRLIIAVKRTLLKFTRREDAALTRMFRAFGEASWKHEVRPYSGRVLHVASEEIARDAASGPYWRSKCIGSYVRIVLPGATHHAFYSGAIADAVMEHIERALAGAVYVVSPG